MESLEGVINLLLYCVDAGEELPDKELLKSRSPIVQSQIDDNILTLDKITGEGMFKDNDHLDNARFYIYYEINKNNINYDELDAHADLYRRLKQDDAPTDDDGNLLLTDVF